MSNEIQVLLVEILVGLICVGFWYWWTSTAIKRAEEEPRPKWRRSPEWDDEDE